MQQIIQYRANDGSVWNSAEAAKRRDDLHAAVTAALAILGPPFKSRGVSLGMGYVQHRVARVLAARATFAAVARAYAPTLCANMPDDWHPNFGPWGRFLTDSDDPLARGWTRFACIDDQGREWDQPYYANNPQPGAVCVEDRR